MKRIFARYFNKSEDIEDLVQETFVRCFSAEIKNEINNPKSFLLRAAKNLALSEKKKKFRTTTDTVGDTNDLTMHMEDNHPSVETSIDNKRKLAVLSEALASLPEDYRRAFIMRKVDNLKLSQIATRTNVSVRTAQKRVARALDMCDIYLRNKGYDPTEFGRAAPDVANTKLENIKSYQKSVK